MAKFGEGDPRWIVAEREDGANVNNWHWTEYNCTAWSKEKLETLLSNIVFKDDSDGYAKTTKVDSIQGEVTVGSRKGKIYFFYELDIKISWEGKLKEKVCTGKFHLPNIENDEDDFEVNVSSDESSKESSALKDILRKQGISIVRAKFDDFVQQLKKEHSEKILKRTPSKNDSPQVNGSTSTSSSTQSSSKPSSSSSSSSSTKSPKTGDTSSIHMKHSFNAPPIEIFNAHLDAPRISACTQSLCQIEPKEGSKFVMFGGNVTGEIVKLESPKKIVEKWRFQHWPEGHFSHVTLEFDKSNHGTRVTLNQTHIPTEDVERVEQGWKENFWTRMMIMCGWGGMIV